MMLSLSKESQRSRSVSQDRSRSSRLFWQGKGLHVSYYRINSINRETAKNAFLCFRLTVKMNVNNSVHADEPAEEEGQAQSVRIILL